jgi:hypothetical protein
VCSGEEKGRAKGKEEEEEERGRYDHANKSDTNEKDMEIVNKKANEQTDSYVIRNVD